MIRTQTHYGALSRIWVCRPKKENGTASNIGLKIDGELCFEKHICGCEIQFILYMYNSSI